MPPLGEAQILEAIASGDQAAADIARRAGMSILELAEHVCTPRNLEALGRVAKLHAIEREMLLGKLKRDALVRLAELTDEVPAGSADEIRAFEVMRRACRDLLRYGGLNTEKRSSRPGGPGGSKVHSYHPEPITPAFEAEVLEALERLGEEANQYEPRTPGEPSGPSRRTSGSVCGCHGQVPPARVCENPADSRANSLKQRACPWHPSPEVHPSPETPPEAPPPELTTRTGGTPMPPMPPAPPRDGVMGPGQSRHCPGCPVGGHEDHAGPGTKHGTVGLDQAHPP